MDHSLLIFQVSIPYQISAPKFLYLQSLYFHMNSQQVLIYECL